MSTDIDACIKWEDCTIAGKMEFAGCLTCLWMALNYCRVRIVVMMAMAVVAVVWVFVLLHTVHLLRRKQTETETLAVESIALAATHGIVSEVSSAGPISMATSSNGSEHLTQSQSKVLDIAVCLPWAVRSPPSIVNTVRYLLNSPGLARDRFGIFVWRSWPARNDWQTYSELLELGAHVETANEDYVELAGSVPLRLTRNDPPDQMRWRLRHVLDYANLLERCAASKAQFCLAIEDDLLPAKEAIGKALDFGTAVLSGRENDWWHATLYSGEKRAKKAEDISGKPMKHGNVALLFHCRSLPELIAYLRKEAFEWPPDILNYYFFLKVKRGRLFERTPNIFQHASPRSTYSGVNSKMRSSEKWRSRTFRLDEAKNLSHFHVRKGDRYIGCFHDNDTNPTLRDLTGLYNQPIDRRAGAMSIETCRSFCTEYLYFGLQRGRDCFCGNEFGRHGVAAESACNMRCLNGHSACGGPLHNSVYGV